MKLFYTAKYGNVTIKEEKYANGCLAVCLETTNMGEPIGKLSVNLPESEKLNEGEFFVKDYSENQLIIEDAMASGWFELVPDKFAQAGSDILSCWKIREKQGLPILYDDYKLSIEEKSKTKGNTLMKTTFETIMNNLGMVESSFYGETMYLGAISRATLVRDEKIRYEIVRVFAKDMKNGFYRVSYESKEIREEDGKSVLHCTIHHHFAPLHLVQVALTNPCGDISGIIGDYAIEQVTEYAEDTDVFSSANDYLDVDVNNETKLGEPFPTNLFTVRFKFQKGTLNLNPVEGLKFIMEYMKDKQPLEYEYINPYWLQVLDSLMLEDHSVEVYYPDKANEGRYIWGKIDSREGSLLRLSYSWNYVSIYSIRGVRKAAN